MATTLEYILKLRDDFSGKFSKITIGVDKLTDKFNKATKEPKKLGSSIDDLRAKLDGVNKVKFSTHLAKEFQSAHIAAEKLEKKIAKMQKGISGDGIMSNVSEWRKDFSSNLPGADLIKNPLTLATAGVAGIWGATQKALESGKEKTQLQVLTGSKQIGETMFNELTKFATDTVFGTELYGMAGDMLSYGIKDSDVMPLMKQLGDISMGDANKLGALSLAFSQVSGTGKLMGQDLNQMINAGFNPLQEISRTTGESMESLKDRMSKGKVTVEEVRNAFTTATGSGGKFNGMLEQIANTPFGQLEGFKGQLEQIAVQIGTVFIPVFSKLMQGLTWLMDKAAPIIEPLAIVIGVLSVGLLGLAAAQWAVNVAMLANPIGLIIVAIVALIALIVSAINKFDEWGAAILLLLGPIGWIVNMVMALKNNWNSIKEAFTDGGILAGIKRIGIVLLDAILYPVQQLLGMLAKIPGMAKIAEGAAGKIANIRKKLEIVDPPKKKEVVEEGIDDPLKSQFDVNGIATGLDNHKRTNEAIVTGGQKNTTINISMKSMVELIQITASNMKEGTQNMEDQVADALLRTIAMATTTAG